MYIYIHINNVICIIHAIFFDVRHHCEFSLSQDMPEARSMEGH